MCARRFLAALAVAAWLLASPARAISVRDVIELSQAGIGEDVLVELVELEPPGTRIAPADLVALKEAGVSDRVVVAMIRAVRTALDRRERAEAAEAAQARAHQAAAEACVEARPEPREPSDSHSRTQVRIESVPVPVPVPVLVQQVVHVGTPRPVAVGTRGHTPGPSHGGGARLPVDSRRAGAADRENEPEKRAHWIVNSSGWIIK